LRKAFRLALFRMINMRAMTNHWEWAKTMMVTEPISSVTKANCPFLKTKPTEAIVTAEANAPKPLAARR